MPVGAWCLSQTGKSMRRFHSEESGQSLILIAISMTVIIAVAAFAIDAASWMQRHHQTQVVADSAALAAANCLANPGTTGSSIEINGTEMTMTPCSSGTDTTDAATVAEDYAKANGVAITDPSKQISFDTSTDQVTVSATATSGSFFATLFGIGSTTQTSGAQAKWTNPTTSSCSTPGASCAAVFAMGSSCANSGSEPGGSPIVLNGQSDTISGTVHSNGSIYEGYGDTQSLGQTTFGNGSGCAITTNGSSKSGDTWGGSSTPPSSGEAPISTWPTDYTKIVTACGSGLTYACTGPYGTPSYCTEAAGTAGHSNASGAGSSSGFDYGGKSEVPTSGQVWCAYGSGNPSNPSTWNGLIYLQSDSTTVTGNWIGGTIEFGNAGWTLSPQITTFPVLYATGSGSCSPASSGGVCITSGTQTITGSIFAPNGMLQFNGGSTTTNNFLEAQDVDFIGGSQKILGTGPPSGNGGPPTPGTDTLAQ